MLQSLVLQFALFNPMMSYVSAVIWANEHYYPNPVSLNPFMSYAFGLYLGQRTLLAKPGWLGG